MRKSIFWGLAALLTFGVRWALDTHPEWTEQYYTLGLYAGIRWVLDGINGVLPFPSFYLVVAALLWGIYRGVRFLGQKNKSPWQEKVWKTARGVVVTCCVVYVLFHWLWGFNYARPELAQQLGLTLPEIDLTALKQELDGQTLHVLALRSTLQPDTGMALALPQFVPQDLQPQLRHAVAARLQAMQLPAVGAPVGRQPFWKGFLLRFGAAGIYNPFTGECNVDKGLPELTQPYTMAHELCHGYGFGDEGACNFFAYQALKNHPNPALRYSGELGYWRELARAYRRADSEGYKAVWDQVLPGGFKKDLLYIAQTIDQYPEYFEVFRVKAYDQYLKAQGIPEGMGNYGKVIALNLAYKQKTQ